MSPDSYQTPRPVPGLEPVAAGDPAGESNSRLTPSDPGWMPFGLRLRSVAVFGLLPGTGVVDVGRF